MGFFGRSSLIGAFLFATVCGAPAAPSVTLSPSAGHPQQQFSVSGSGFNPNRLIDVYWDTTDVLLVTSNANGAFSSHNISVPADALPGAHWVTAGERDNGLAAQAAFYVRTIWAEYGFSARGKRFNPWENVISPANVNRLDMAWTFKTGDVIYSSPAVAYGKVYVGSYDGKLYALDAITGAKQWSATTGASIVYSSPAVSGSTVYVGSGDHYLWAFDATTGAFKWKYQTGSFVDSSPTVANGTVYVGSGDNSLYALDAATGALKWSAATGSIIYSTPAVADGSVFVGSYDNSFYAFNAATGAPTWSLVTGGQIIGSPGVAYGRVFVGSTDHNFYAMSLADGTTSVTSFGNAVFGGPALAYGQIYLGDYSGDFHALTSHLDASWDSNAGNPINASAAVANGIVYFGDSAGYFRALDAGSGALLWSARLGTDIDTSSPAVADGMVYLGSTDHRLYAFAIDGGNAAVYHRDKNPPRMELLHPNRRLKPSR